MKTKRDWKPPNVEQCDESKHRTNSGVNAAFLKGLMDTKVVWEQALSKGLLDGADQTVLSWIGDRIAAVDSDITVFMTGRRPRTKAVTADELKAVLGKRHVDDLKVGDIVEIVDNDGKYNKPHQTVPIGTQGSVKRLLGGAVEIHLFGASKTFGPIERKCVRKVQRRSEVTT